MTISNRDDIIDSRDVIKELEEGNESLAAIAHEGERISPDWKYGESLVRESHFVDYAKSLAEDIGHVTGSEAWPLNCIDWEKAAAELRQDYSQVDYDGVTYLIRNG